MKMKALGLWLATVFLAAGCRTSAPGWTEKPLGCGRYSVVPPEGITQITGTNSNPTIWIWDCGQIQVRVNSFKGNRQGDIWIDWLQGTVADETVDKGSVEPAPGPVPSKAAADGGL